MEYYTDALELINNNKHEEFINSLAECCKIEQIIASIPTDLVDKINNICNTIIQKYINTCIKIDENARICYTFINSGSNLKHIIDFLNDSIEKYPNSYYFLSARGCLYNFLENRKKGLQDFNNILNKYPDDEETLYHKAVTLRLTNGKQKESIKYYNMFIDKAPKDHRKIPESYYAIGVCYSLLLEYDIKRLKEYYKMGYYC